MSRTISTVPLIEENDLYAEQLEIPGLQDEPLTSSFNKYLILLDIIPVILWITLSSMGSIATTILHFIFATFYSMSINSTRSKKDRKPRTPFVMLLLSLIYSTIYLIGELVAFFLTKSATINSLPSILSYFDVFSYEETPKIPNLYFVFIATLFVDIIYIILYFCLINDIEWYKKTKARLLMSISHTLQVIFLFDLSLAVCFSTHKYLLFLPVLFGICCFVAGTCQRPFNAKITAFFWHFFYCAILIFLLLISSDLVLTVDPTPIPRWLRVATVCIAGFISSIYCGNNQNFKINSPIRIVGQWKMPFIISGFAPFVVIISSLFFCLCQLSWSTFVGLILGVIPTFFGNRIMAVAAPIIFSINIVVVVLQLILTEFMDQYYYESVYHLIIPFIFTAFSAVTLTNAKGAYFKTEETNEETSGKNISLFQNVIGIVLIVGFFTAASLFSTIYPVIITNVLLMMSVLFAICGFFNKLSWGFLMLITMVSAIAQLVITLLLRFTSFNMFNEKLYDLFFISIDPKTDPIYLSLWPVFVLFILALLIKSLFLPPNAKIVSIFSSLVLTILTFLPIILLKNSVFTVAYLVFFTVLLFMLRYSNPKTRSINSVLYGIFATVHLTILLLYNFEDLRNSILNENLRVALGLPRDGSPYKNTAGCLFLTLYIFFMCFVFKFGMMDSKFSVIPCVKALFSIFSFYMLLFAIYFAVLVDHSSSIIYIIIFAVMGIVRIFTRKGQIVGFILFFVFLTCYLFQKIVSLIPVSAKFEKVVDYIGPSVSTEYENCFNIIALFTAFSFSISNVNYEFPEKIINITNYLRRLLLVIVQISLAFTALKADEGLAPISAIILLFLSFKKSISKVFASLLNFIMILLITYVMFFMMMPLKTVNNVTKYFMLNEASPTDVSHAFFHLLTCTLLLEFGVNVMPGFGNICITAKAFPIFSAIVMVVSFNINDYLSLIHTILFVVMLTISMMKWKTNLKFINYIFYYTLLVIFYHAARHTPWFKDSQTIDKIFVCNNQNIIKWIVIFVFEFLLVVVMRGPEYEEVQNREVKRKEFRETRAKTFREIVEKDEEFIKEYFNSRLLSLQSDFAVLTVEGSYVPYPIKEEDFKKIDKGYEDDANLITLTETTEEINLTETDHDPPSRSRVYRGKIIKVFKAVFHYLVDFTVRHFMLICDINLEPGMSVQGVEKISEFYDVMLQNFRQTHKLDIPDEWADFALTIPYSLRQHFRLISKLKIHEDRKKRRFQLLRRYSSLVLRNIFPILLVLLALFYPFVQKSSFVAFLWILTVFVSISLRIHTYKQYFLIAIITMSIRFIVQLPYLYDLLIKYSTSVSENQRNIPILTIFSLSNLQEVFSYDSFLLIFSIFSVAYLSQHPAIPNNKVKGDFFARITKYSAYRVGLPTFIFLIDFIGLVILFIAYGSWSFYGNNIISMVSGSSSVSLFYVLLVMFQLCFMLCGHIFYLAKSALWYFLLSLTYAFFSFFVVFFVIPYSSKRQCWWRQSFNFYVVCRLIAQFLMACQLNLGFSNEPPKISKKKPFFTMIYEIVVRAVPFLFEFIVVMKWIANKTSISLFNTIILQHVKSKLKGIRASSRLFPPKKQEGRIEGILFLVIMIVLLFVPLFLLSTSDSTTVLNSASIIQSQFGVAGLTNFYDNQITIENSLINIEQQSQIAALNDTALLTFYSMPLSQIQIIDLPFGSMSEFLITPDAMNEAIISLKKNESTFIPYGKFSFYFKIATTKNKAQNVVYNLFGNNLNETQKMNLSEALDSTPDDPIIVIPKFIPMFLYVPYDDLNGYFDNYFYDAVFQIVKNGNVDFWKLITVPSSDNKKLPDFLNKSNDNITRLVLWSQPTPDKLIGSILTSTGGIIGLYVFIIITIGQFVTMWIAGLFTDLWISRMHNPMKMLNVLLAIEAYQLSDKLDKEFELSELVLENLRSTTRIIQLTDIANSNCNYSLENNLTSLRDDILNTGDNSHNDNSNNNGSNDGSVGLTA